MKYEFFETYKVEDLPKNIFVERDHICHSLYAFHLYAGGDYPMRWFNQGGSLGAFVPINSDRKKYVFVAGTPSYRIEKEFTSSCLDTIKQMKELKEKINSL